MLSVYTEQESRFDTAFSGGATCCSIDCEGCGRTYFVTSDGHGDYDDGELEELYAKAKEQPQKYIEVPDFDSVAMVHLEGKQLIIGCECGAVRKYADWIESHAQPLTKYLKLYWLAKKNKADTVSTQTTEYLASLPDPDERERIYEKLINPSGQDFREA